MSKSLKLPPEKMKQNFNSVSKNSKIAIYSMIFPIILQLDIVIVTYLFDSVLTSKYIVVSTISKIIYFFFGSIYPIIFNEFLDKIKKIKIGLVLFYISSIIIGGLIITIGGKYFIILTYDQNFHSSANLIYLICPSIILLSLSNIACSYLIAEKSYNFVKYLTTTALIFVLTTIYITKSIELFVLIFFSMCLIIFLISILNLIKLNLKK